MIHRVPEKQIRYDGVTVPGNPHHMSPSPSDPRKKPIPSLWRRMEDLDLPIPRFVIDDNYVGEPPKVRVEILSFFIWSEKQMFFILISC